MQLVKIGLFLILLSIILFFLIKDNKRGNNSIGSMENFENKDSLITDSVPEVGTASGSCGSGSEGQCGSVISNEGAVDKGGCSSCGTTGSTQLLPVMDPLFNMREICKQSILLEDHLFQKKKRCRDCCIKHQLTIEALAEEAITLDKDRKCEDLYYLPDKIRELQKDFVNGREPGDIAHEYRKLRKSLMQRCFNNF